jgi:hypothetical protein
MEGTSLSQWSALVAIEKNQGYHRTLLIRYWVRLILHGRVAMATQQKESSELKTNEMPSESLLLALCSSSDGGQCML